MLRCDKTTHQYYWNDQEIPSVSQVIEEVFHISAIFSQFDTNTMKKLRELGTRVHTITQRDDEEKLEPEDAFSPEWGYVDAWRRFQSEMSFTPLLIETPLYSELGFAGTPDRVGTLNGRSAIVDIKTGAVYWWYGVALAGYYQLVYESRNPQFPFPIERVLVQLSHDGLYKCHMLTDKEDRTAFLAAITLVNYRKHKGG